VAHPNSKRAKAAKEKRSAERRDRVATGGSSASSETQRAAQRDEVLARRRRAARSRKVRNRGAIIVAVALVATGLWFGLRPDPELPGVTEVADDGGGHITNAAYASATPTSGRHIAASPNCGTRATQLDAPLAVHALEHGVVLVWYDAKRPELGTQLADLVSKWKSHVIVSPNARLRTAIVATAWDRLKAYPSVTPEINDFIKTYRFRGPESVACDR